MYEAQSGLIPATVTGVVESQWNPLLSFRLFGPAARVDAAAWSLMSV
jgi:hypothetical protein